MGGWGRHERERKKTQLHFLRKKGKQQLQREQKLVKGPKVFICEEKKLQQLQTPADVYNHRRPQCGSNVEASFLSTSCDQ